MFFFIPQKILHMISTNVVCQLYEFCHDVDISKEIPNITT